MVNMVTEYGDSALYKKANFSVAEMANALVLQAGKNPVSFDLQSREGPEKLLV